jgi:hypothetical protein
MAKRWNNRRRKHRRVSGVHILLSAGVAGVLVGVGSIGTTSEGRDQLLAVAGGVGVVTGLARERAPQSGDDWRRCDDARAAGTAPIYRGEPGYREGLDADNDGIACEPYRGQ